MRFLFSSAFILIFISILIINEANADMSILERSKVKTIYIMQFSHLDIGYTHPQPEVAKICVRTIDHAIQYCDDNPDFKWTVESLWQLEQWMKDRKPEDIDHFMTLVKKGQIGLTACFAGLHSGLIGSEEFNRLMYFAESLRDKYGVDISTAVQNDITGYSWAYPQVFAKSGIKYFATGINTFIGAGAEIPIKDRPFYWEGPDGSRVLTYISHDPFTGGSGYLYALLYSGWGKGGRAEETVPALLTNLEKSDYPYDAILVMSGGTKDNDDAELTLLDGVHEWNAKHASPKMVIAAPDVFFKHITSKYGDKFPVYRGDWSGLWEQVKETLPYGTSVARNVHESLPTAESLAALNELVTGDTYPADKLNSAWKNVILFEEHSGGGGVVPDMMTREQAAEESRVKLSYAVNAKATADEVMWKSVESLLKAIKTEGDEILVWNPSGIMQSNFVQTQLNSKWRNSGLTLIDKSTGKNVSFQKCNGGEIIFKADNVPGLGYKIYRLSTASSGKQISGLSVSADSIENEYIRISVTPEGRIQSIYDKQKKREYLQRNSWYNFGQLVRTDEGRMSNGQYEIVPVHAKVSIGMSGPEAVSLIITDKESPLARTEIVLQRGSRAVRVNHAIDWSRMPKANHRYDLVYPLDIPGGQLVYDTPAGLLDPSKDMMPKAWRVIHVNRGGDITGPVCGVTIASKQAFNWEFGRMNSYWGGVLPPDSTTLMMRLMNNINFAQYKGEGHGDYVPELGAPDLRTYENIFLLHDGSGKFGLDKVTDFLYAESKPFAAFEITENEEGILPGKSGRFIDIKGQGLQLLAFKKAENGDGYVLRMMETHNRDTKLLVSSGILRIDSAELVDNTERKLSEVGVKDGRAAVSVSKREIITLRLRFKPVKQK